MDREKAYQREGGGERLLSQPVGGGGIGIGCSRSLFVSHLGWGFPINKEGGRDYRVQ